MASYDEMSPEELQALALKELTRSNKTTLTTPKTDLFGNEMLEKGNNYAKPGSPRAGKLLQQQSAALSNVEKERELSGHLFDKADIKKYIGDLVAANEADRVLSALELRDKEVSTGPIRSRFFDSSVPKFNEKGEIIPPGMIDSVITNLFPKQTKEMRLLDALIQGMAEYGFEKGGKQLTGTEKPAIFSRFPTRFDTDELFGAVTSQARQQLNDYVEQKVKILKALGADEKSVMQIISKDVPYSKLSDEALINLKNDQTSENNEGKSYLGRILSGLRSGAVDIVKSGGIENAGMTAGSLFGPTGGALGAASGKNIEDLLLYLTGEGPSYTLGDQLTRNIEAGARGATSGMAGGITSKVLGSVGNKLLAPIGKFAKERIAPRLMTSVVKNPDLAEEMLKRGEYGTIRSLLTKGEKGVEEFSKQVDDLLSNVKTPVDRKKIVDELETLRREYARLPGRDTEVAAIQELQTLIYKAPSKNAVVKGAVDYTKLKSSAANKLKRDIYAENRKLYQGGNYDPASIRAQTDMAVARGLKKGIEGVAPKVGPLNEELGHNIELRDTMQTLLDKSDKANIVQLRPLLAGLGLLQKGTVPAATAPVGFNLAGTMLGGSGGAILAKKVGEKLMTRSGTPTLSFLAKLLTQAGLQELQN